jgi:anti-sigma factor RsiW
MNCDEVMELMQRHLDGDLNNEEHKRMLNHLEACPECADMMERLQQIDQDLASLPKVMPAFSLVDSILPKLSQLDMGVQDGAANAGGRFDAAASEMHLVSSVPPQGEQARSQRPWYARGKLVRIGGLAAAAAMLGILMVNGLPKGLEESATRVTEQSTASNSADMPMMMSTESSAEEKVMMDSAAPAAEEPKAESASGSSQAFEGSAVEATKEENPSDAQTHKAEQGDNVDVSGAGEHLETQKTSKLAPEADARYESAGEPVPVDETEVGAQRNGIQSIDLAATGDGTSETFNGIMSIPEEPVYVASLTAVSGGRTAHVQQLPDGALTVVVLNEAGDVVFASSLVWETNADVQLSAWNDEVLTYIVKTEAGVHSTFEIDTAAASEQEIVE